MKKLTLGSYLKNARLRKSLSIIEVANRLNLDSVFSVSSWERNHGDTLPLNVLRKLIPLYDLNEEIVFDLLLQYQLSRIEEKVKVLTEIGETR